MHGTYNAAVNGCQAPLNMPGIKQFVLHDANNVPCDKRGYPINAHDTALHQSGLEIARLSAETGLGISLVLKPNDPFFFIDLDHVYDPATSTWSQLALDIFALFHGAYMEVSSSGRGAHIVAFGSSAVAPDHICKINPNLEFYTHSKPVALTGYQACGNAALDMSGQLVEFVRRYNVCSKPVAVLQSGPAADYEGPADDNLLVQAMCDSPGSIAMMYGERCHPKHFWVGDTPEIAKHYPAAGRADGLPYDASSADLALCGHLAFWTGRDAGRIERLWLASALGRRPKVQARAGYRHGTITAACTGRTAIYDKGFRKNLNAAIGDDEKTPDIRPMILTLEQMRDKLVMIESTAEVVHWDLGRPRTWVNALGAYAGSVYTWETTDGKIKEAPALSVWRRDHARKSVDVLTWAPGRSKICTPPDYSAGNSRAFNTWLGLQEFPRPSEDHSRPFIEHLEYLIPIAEERVRFVQWLGHIIQRPQELPHTCYLMVTPQTGIGRNWIASVLARVFRGYAALSVKISKILDGEFNGCLAQKLIAFVDEAREGMSEKKYAKAQALKELITQEARQINPKYGRQSVEFNCCRWLMFSNHFDALPLDTMDRRVIVIKNPEVRRAAADYARLYAMVHDYNFIASVYNYLANVDLTGFNAGDIAQMTDVKRQVISSSTSEADNLAAEFREEYTGHIATLETIRQFINRGLTVPITDRALVHAIENAGMQRVLKRIIFENQKISIVCVKGITAEQVNQLDSFQLRQYFGNING